MKWRFFAYSPRMWRWSWDSQRHASGKRVFSTYVEVILSAVLLLLMVMSILHVCGGDPIVPVCGFLIIPYSPRMWRWSHIWNIHCVGSMVFSTYVEVILTNPLRNYHNGSILHVCGGDPKLFDYISLQARYSPRMWRWSRLAGMKMGCLFVFSTYVEVILGKPFPCLCQCRILHVCGGDPDKPP